MSSESFAAVVIATQKELAKLRMEDVVLHEFDHLLPKPRGTIPLPILKPDNAMTVKQLIEKLSALDSDLKVYVRYDAGCNSGGGTWIDDVADTDKYEVLDMESHVVIDVT